MEPIHQIAFEARLRHHLQHNHYPSLLALLPVAEYAISLATNAEWDDDVWQESLALPKGVLFRGNPFISLRDAIEIMHLECFLEC